MSKNYNICRICLEDTNELMMVTLKSCTELIRKVAQIEFTEDPGSSMVCHNCLQALEIANRIRVMCLKSKKKLEDVICCLCSLSFDEKSLARHAWEKHKMKIIDKVSGNKDNQCPICMHEFENGIDKDRHRTCDLCFTTFWSDTEFAKHSHTLVVSKEDEAMDVSLQEERVTVMEEVTILDERKPIVIGPTSNVKTDFKRKFGCCKCNFKSTLARERNQHFKAEHSNCVKQNENPSTFACYLCYEDCVDREDRERHLRLGHGLFKCIACREVFHSQRDQANHCETVHKIALAFECPHCDKTFRNIVSLIYHIKSTEEIIHPLKRNFYECEICGKSFNRKESFDAHMNAHNGLKQFQCLICAATFNFASGLRLHMKKHSDVVVKAFKCKYCEKRYTHMRDCKNHMFVHTNNWPFVCKRCGKGYGKKQDYAYHISLDKCKPSTESNTSKT